MTAVKMSAKNNKCPNIGCRESFVHRTQLSRHKKKCTFPVPVEAYVFENGVYRCTNCHETFIHQPNASRHKSKGCKKKKEVTIRCDICLKTFKYQSLLKQHLESTRNHTKNRCQHCDRYFRKLNDFQKHVAVCTPENPIRPTPQKAKTKR